MSGIFFLDENVNQATADLLRLVDYRNRNEIRTLRQHFTLGTPDMEWLKDVSTWAPTLPTVISGDGRIFRNPEELNVLRTCNLHFVYLIPAWMNMRWEDFAWRIAKLWPAIVRETVTTNSPTLFELKTRPLVIEKKSPLSKL